jgi:hypothetical protein
VIPKPLERLTHAPPFPKLLKYQLNRTANSLIGMKDNLTHRVQDVTDREPLEQLAAARFGFLARLEPLPKNLQLHDAECSLDSEDQLVIEII